MRAGEALTIPRVPYTELESLLAGSRPAIVTGFGRGPSSQHDFALESLTERYGTCDVLVVKTVQGRVLGPGLTSIQQRIMRLDRFAEALAAGRGDLYVASPVTEELGRLRHEIELPGACRRASWLSMRLWIGPPGITTSLHHDLPDNLLLQLAGKKRVILVDRAERRNCYPHEPWSKVPNFSRVDAENPDYDRFPRFRRVAPWSGELEAGEALFIPRLWWHQLTSVETSVSLNVWYASGIHAAFSRGAQLAARVRAGVAGVLS